MDLYVRYGLFGIEDYTIVVRVCHVKYAYGVVFLALVFYVYGGDTQWGCGP